MIASKNSAKIRSLFSGWAALKTAYVALFFGFFYIPILVLVVLSFNDSPVMGFPVRTLTTDWYTEALADGHLTRALFNSFQIGLASAAAGTTLALMTVLGLRYRFRFGQAVLPLIVLPIVMPGIVTGVIMMVSFGLSGVNYGLWPATFIIHVTWVLPFAFLTLYPRLHGFDRSIEEAAMDLGARPFTVFYRIVLPIIRPAILGTFLFAFTLSFDEFVRTFFVIGSQRTVPVHLWVLVTEQVAPFLPAVGVIIMLLTLSAAAAGFISLARSSGHTVKASHSEGIAS
jgi:spermidine/putrescine transport system permease protein